MPFATDIKAGLKCFGEAVSTRSAARFEMACQASKSFVQVVSSVDSDRLIAAGG